MHPLLRVFLAVIAGWVVGSILNMALVSLGPSIIAMPEGFVPGDVEWLKENAHLLKSKHFVFPYLGHQLGALLGAIVAVKIGRKDEFKLATAIGVLFLLGGIMVSMMVPAPIGFIILDLASYLPFAWLGWKIAK